MNFRILSKFLGVNLLLLGAAVLLSLPWAFPLFGQTDAFEAKACLALLGTSAIAIVLGGSLRYLGRSSNGYLYRKEAMAVVGLSWILATILGAVPFLLSRTHRGENVPMSIADALFESASGFTGAGATVITNLEDPNLVPRSILFWRSETHLLGGLGIMVLFVAILGQGSAGKALMLSEMPGPTKESGHTRMQHAAWVFSSIYFGLIALLSVLLWLQGMTLFDALCHAFGTIATGGFSTYNDSVAHFQDLSIEMTIAVFMVLACTNFALLYLLVLWKPKRMFADVEFRVYLTILGIATLFLAGFGLFYEDFGGVGKRCGIAFFRSRRS